jgi:Holliday junction resolvasome RuvABC ATP-dependent DNA helicase subunit
MASAIPPGEATESIPQETTTPQEETAPQERTLPLEEISPQEETAPPEEISPQERNPSEERTLPQETPLPPEDISPPEVEVSPRGNTSQVLTTRRREVGDETSPSTASISDSSYVLTRSQSQAIEELKLAGKAFSVLCLVGKRGSGKKTVARGFFDQQRVKPIELEPLTMINQTHLEVTLIHLKDYLEKLQRETQRNLLQTSTHPSTEIWIFLPDWDDVMMNFTDIYAKNRRWAIFTFGRWLSQLPERVKILLTAEDAKWLDHIHHWTIEVETTLEDMKCVLGAWCRRHQRLLDPTIVSQILKISKVQTPFQIIQSLSYAHCGSYGGKEIITDTDFVALYRTALMRFHKGSIDAEEDVCRVDVSRDLVGLEAILMDVEQLIIRPMTIGHPRIPIKRGIVLAGPPGTGKTSIGRWLAQRLKGKFYLVTGGSSSCGARLLETFESKMRLASDNAPAIVFVDDVDQLFDNTDYYRAFLTILDGVINKRREGVCVMVTCMDIGLVPSSLMRGGRLEMCLQTQLPSSESIEAILNTERNTMLEILRECHELQLEDGEDDDTQEMIEILQKQWTAELTHCMSKRLVGLNCADVRRMVNDVTRYALSLSASQLDLEKLMVRILADIRKQYLVCQTNHRLEQSQVHNAYIV